MDFHRLKKKTTVVEHVTAAVIDGTDGGVVAPTRCHIVLPITAEEAKVCHQMIQFYTLS